MRNRIKGLLILTFFFAAKEMQAAGLTCLISEINSYLIAILCLLGVFFLFLYRRVKQQSRIISDQEKEIKSAKIISDSVFGNIHSYILLIDKDFVVQRTNYYTLTSIEDRGEKKKVGNLLMCTNALSSGGCGNSSLCSNCPVRRAIKTAFKEKRDFNNLSASLKLLVSTTETIQFDALISGSYLILNKQEYLLLTIFDITQQNKIRDNAERINAQFNITFNTLPLAIAICDKDGFINKVNNYYIETMGITKENTIYNINIFNNPCIPDSIKNKMTQGEYISEEVTYDFQKLNRSGYFKSTHSNRQYFRLIVDYMRNRDGQIEKLILTWVNNTLIHNTLKQNKKIMNMFSFVSSASKIGFSSVNMMKDDSIVTPEYLINLGEEENTNIKNIINQYSHVHPEDRQELLLYTERVLQEKNSNFTFDKDIRVSDKSGDWKWVRQVLIQKTFDPENKSIEVLGMNIDITRQKETEEKLRKAQQQAENSDKLKSVFLSNMSHEIRTPLNAIVGFSRLLVEAETEDEKNSYIEIINNNNQLLLQLISDILDLSKIEANTLEFIYSNVNINSLFKDIEQITRMKAGETNPVEITFEPELPYCFIFTERNRLSQVINNFLANALKFTKKGSIRFGYKKRENDLYFYVSDTGEGIPKEKHEQLFDRFVKLDKFKAGTGLGLAICKSIVVKLGGEIGVDSELGKGSTFWFTLPVKPTELPETDDTESSPAVSPDNKPNADNEKEVSNDPKPKYTLLIAEDMKDNYKLYEILLGKKYNLLHAWNGQEAIELFVEHHPDAILMDIRMPILDGYGATEAIRQISSDVPIIGVTAFAFIEDKEKILSSGFNKCITKPIIPKTLLEVLTSIGI